MQIQPSFDRFRALAEEATLVPVWREFLFDVDTAVTAYAKLAEPPFGFLLESVVGGEQWVKIRGRRGASLLLHPTGLEK